jgi:Phage P22-like portal protein
MARKAGDAEVLREAKERFERCVVWESKARANALADAKFANGDSVNQAQWDPAVRAARGDRPCLTMNKARQHLLMVVNDSRQHKAQIKVTPTGGQATYEAAQIFSGIIRRIEYQSKAVDAYGTAIYHQVETGIGYCRVVTDYADDDSFDQEIFIRRVPDPRTIYLDPDSRDYDKADMRFAFCFNDIPRDRYEAEHGRGDMVAPAALDHSDGWNDKDHVREAEYWRRNDRTETVHLMADGSHRREHEIGDGDRAGIVRSREVSEPEIEWFRIVGDRIEEREAWPGKYIPLVPFIGEEVIIEGQMDRKGHIRCLIDSQRMYNYWASSAVEHVALQGKTPYVAPARAVEGFESYWDSANVRNFSFLPYNDVDDSGQPIQRPERAQPPVMAQAYIQGMSIAKDDMMLVSGQYESEMGQPGNERSGTAISQRQRQSDRATYHYVDNAAKAIRQIGRICLDLIPKIYDTVRVTKIMGEDGSSSDVALVPHATTAHQHVAMGPNGPQPVTDEQAAQMKADPDTPNPKIIFSPLVGRYSVEADVGADFATQRQESANAFSQIMQQNPAAFQIVGDFWARNSDFPGADELAERLKRGLPPNYAGGPDPQVEKLQQAMQQQGQNAQKLLGQADAELSHAKAEVALLREQLRDKSAGTDNDTYKAETERLKAVAAADPGAAMVLIRSMLSQLLGMPALPVIHEHQAADAAHQQEIMPPDPAQQPQPNGAGP